MQVVYSYKIHLTTLSLHILPLRNNKSKSHILHSCSRTACLVCWREDIQLLHAVVAAAAVDGVETVAVAGCSNLENLTCLESLS